MKLQLPFAIVIEVYPEFPDDLWDGVPRENQQKRWELLEKYLEEHEVKVKVNKTFRITSDMFCTD